MRSLALLLVASLAVGASAISAPPASTQSAVDPVEQAIAALHERKLSATFADLAPAPIPDEKNGALDIVKAAAISGGNDGGPSSSEMEYGDELPYSKEWFDLARRNATANAEAATLLHSARIKAGIAWPNPPTAPFEKWLGGSFAKDRQLANVIKDIALYQHFNGEEAQAIESLRDLEFLGDAVSRKPFLIAKLVSIGISGAESHATQIVAAGLKIKPAADPEGSVQRAAVRSLISELFDDATLRNAYRRAMEEERTLLIEKVRGGDLSAVWAVIDFPGSIAAYDVLAGAMDKHPWEAVNVASSVMMQTIIPSLNHTRGIVWREIAMRRMAAIALACALYRNDHGGYPPDLAALVPEYLAEIPADPFARDGATLRYAIVDNGSRPLIGTVGLDGQPTEPGLYKKTAYRGQYGTNGEPIWLDLSPWKAHQ